MEPTTQINIRMPKRLVYDMEYIAENLGVNRNDWLKVKIAEMIQKEVLDRKFKIQEKAENDFIYGKIDAKTFKKKMGFKPSQELIDKRTYQKGMDGYFEQRLNL